MVERLVVSFLGHVLVDNCVGTLSRAPGCPNVGRRALLPLAEAALHADLQETYPENYARYAFPGRPWCCAAGPPKGQFPIYYPYLRRVGVGEFVFATQL
jgi:hypothetical protein